MNEVPQEEVRLLAEAEKRIGWFILVLIPPGAAASWWFWETAMALAFVVGGAVAYLNYLWIASVVDALVRVQRSRLDALDYAKLLAPLVLMGLVLYGIFSVSLVPFVGVASGVLLLVPAVFLEAVVQIVLGVRQ